MEVPALGVAVSEQHIAVHLCRADSVRIFLPRCSTTRTAAPAPGAAITVTSTVTQQTSPLASVQLYYAVGYGPETSMPMTGALDGYSDRQQTAGSCCCCPDCSPLVQPCLRRTFGASTFIVPSLLACSLCRWHHLHRHNSGRARRLAGALVRTGHRQPGPVHPRPAVCKPRRPAVLWHHRG